MPITAIERDHPDRKIVSFSVDPYYARNHDLVCPLCEGDLSYVKQHTRSTAVINPYFRHASPCPYFNDETPEHQQMKIYAAQLFGANNYGHVEFEKVIGDQVADVVINRNIRVFNPDRKPGVPNAFPSWVIECENTSNGRNIEARTQNYQLPVLWLFNSQRLDAIDDKTGYCAKSTNDGERFMNAINGGTVLYLSPETPRIYPVHYSWGSGKWKGKRYLVKGAAQDAARLTGKEYAMPIEYDGHIDDIVKLSSTRSGWWK